MHVALVLIFGVVFQQEEVGARSVRRGTWRVAWRTYSCSISTDLWRCLSAAGGGGGKKRPAWDLKGRLEDMEAMLSKNQNANMELNSHIQSNNGRIQLLETINQQLKGTVSQKEIQTSEASREIADLQHKLRSGLKGTFSSTLKLLEKSHVGKVKIWTSHIQRFSIYCL